MLVSYQKVGEFRIFFKILNLTRYVCQTVLHPKQNGAKYTLKIEYTCPELIRNNTFNIIL